MTGDQMAPSGRANTDTGSLYESLRRAAEQALAALADEIDHYAAPGEVPFETRLAHDALADALDALDGNDAETDDD